VPTLIADNGATVTMLTDDGRQVEVAKEHAQPFLPPSGTAPAPDLLPPQDAGAPAPDLLAPGMPSEQPAPDLLPPGQEPAAPLPASPDLLAPGAPAAPPLPEAPTPGPAAAPAPAPLAPTAPPSVIPEAIPQNATQAAAMGLQGLQTQAEATQAGAAAQAAGSAELVGAYDQAEQAIGQVQTQKEQFAAYRQKEEAFLLSEKRTMVDRFKNWKVDRGRVYRQMDTGDKVLAGIGLALGAIGAAFTKADEANPAMDLLLKTLDQDVQLQLAERDQLGSAIGMKSDEIADFRTVSTSRLGEYNTRMAAHLGRLERDVAKIAAKTQSATVKANADAFIGQLQQKGAEMLQQGVTADRAYNEQVRARRAQIANARAQLVEQQRGRDAQMLTKGFLPDPAAPGGYSPDPNRPVDEKQAVDLAKSKAELAKLTEERAVGGLTTTRVNPETGKEEKVSFQAANTETRNKIATMKSSTDTTVRLLDEMILLREKHGWSSDLVRSPEWRAMQANQGAIMLAAKDAYNLGVLSAQDIELVSKMLGSEDPTEIRDPIAGWKKSRQNAINGLNDMIRGEDPKADWYEPPKLEPLAAKERTKEENVDVLTAPLPPGSELDTPAGKSLRAKELERKNLAVPELLRKKPSVEELSTWGQAIDAERAAGRLSAEEALGVVNQMAERAASEWKARIEKRGTEQLLKEQQDPAFSKRMRILNLFMSGAARPEEIYRLVVGQ
jgi:hypothetical protein